MRKFLSVICFMCLVFLATGAMAGAEEFFEFDAAEKPLTVTYNGSEIHFSDTQPEIMDGRTMVPLRAVFERVGCEVSFDDGVITAERENHSVRLSIGSETAQVERDGKSETHTLDAVPVIINDRTLVPIRFIAEALGCQTNWNPNMREVVIIDVDAWKKQIKTDAPLVDFLFSMPLAHESAYLSNGDGVISGKVIIHPKNSDEASDIETEIGFSFKLVQEILSNEGNKQITSRIEMKFDGLKEYAAQMEAGSRKDALRRLASRSVLAIEAVIDSEYNLYLSGSGLEDILAIFSQEQATDVLKGKTLKIPVGTMLSDATGLPLGTILQSETVWDGLEKAIKEDEHLFTQSVKTLDNTIRMLIQCMGGTKTAETDKRNQKETQHYISGEDAPLYKIDFMLQDSDITEWTITAETKKTAPDSAEREQDHKVELEWKIAFSADRSEAGDSKVSVPDKVLDWESFLKDS